MLGELLKKPVGFFFFLLILSITCGFLAGSVAKSKGWGGTSWFWAGFLLGPLGLLGAAGMPDRLLRKYLRQIAGAQDALGNDLITNKFTTKSYNFDEAWRNILACVNPAIASLLSRERSSMHLKEIEIRDIDGFYIGKATVAGEGEGGEVNWTMIFDG